MFHSCLHVCILCILLHAHFSHICSPCKHYPAFSPPKQNRASPLKEVNECVLGVESPPTWKRSNRLSSWQMELGSSKWSYINTCGWKCYDSAYDAWLEKVTVGWKTRWMLILRWLRGRWGFSLELGIRIRGLECFFFWRSAEKYHFG